MSQDSTPIRSPDSGVSPKSQPTAKGVDYFAHRPKKTSPGTTDDSSAARTDSSSPRSPGQEEATATQQEDTNENAPLVKGKRKEVEIPADASATAAGDSASSNNSSGPSSRKTSVSSITFLAPRNPSLPQGNKRPHGAGRIRGASPPHRRFESHVAFDNIPLGESTEHNPISLTLNVRHAGFQFNRRHRIFMVGVDDNAYSDHALQWLLDELVDDGDEIVCVRVIETQVRLADKAYQDDAMRLMESIKAKNTKNHAISLILEFAVGKLHSTFQHLIKIYSPSMLIVGTKGRSHDGVQGFITNRSSFSKYCLQYSPVPVVVVRPTEKRKKKKLKRVGDPSRQSYVNMLAGHKHEADSENSSLYELEPNITADEEAHRVAMAVGLPAAYDPTIKPIDPASLLRNSGRRSAVDLASGTSASSHKGSASSSEQKPPDGADSESESEAEFEVTAGEEIKRERLHKMELNEGAALRAEARKMSSGSADSEDSALGEGASTR
ncbi:hypothetical protein DL764_008153 [Monosporascus ibericus]|uniref:UspA domain-containing protein n=1 Tax=Monosporascus ibericus TaxID=155417 RepID=A0A4Q4T171_9PEZI|nr:hypothetical protein DL764_008153 [Monosporascus ibericus]